MQENFEIRIREISKLKKGWNCGKGEPFQEKHIEVAALLALRYNKQYSLNVSGIPLEDGSIELVFGKDAYFLDLKILPSIDNVEVYFSKGIGKNKIEESWGTFTINQLDKIMDRFIKTAI